MTNLKMVPTSETKTALAGAAETMRRAAAELCDGLATVRAEIGTARAAVDRARAALPSRAEAEAAVRGIVVRLAEEVARTPGALLRLGKVEIEGVLLSEVVQMLHAARPVALLAAVHSKALEAWMMGCLDELAAGQGGWSRLDAAGRAAELARAEDRLLGLELEEEEVVASAEAAGISLPRRPDASPEAVLGLVPAKKAPP